MKLFFDPTLWDKPKAPRAAEPVIPASNPAPLVPDVAPVIVPAETPLVDSPGEIPPETV